MVTQSQAKLAVMSHHLQKGFGPDFPRTTHALFAGRGLHIGQCNTRLNHRMTNLEDCR